MKTLYLLLLACLVISQFTFAQQSTVLKENRLDFLEGASGKSTIVYNGTDLFIDNNETGGDVEIDANTDLIFQTANLTRFTLLANGNGHFVNRLGIGTASPAAQLHLQDATGSKMVFGTGNERFNIILRPNGKVAFEANGSTGNNTLVIDDDGIMGVGIGTDAPTQKLHVVGNARIQGNLLFGSVEALTDGGANQISSNSTIRPSSDNIRDLGTSTFRWNEVWAADGSINTSDGRFKKNVQNISYGMNEIMKLRPVTFTWDQKGYENKMRLGFIAQELKEVLSEVVRTENYVVDLETGQGEWKPTDKMGVAYSEIIPVLVAGMQEQQQVIEEKEARIEELEEKVQKIDALEAELEAIKQALRSNGSLGSNGLPATTNVVLDGHDLPVLEQNTPNPFNGETQIRYYLPEGITTAHLRISANGQVVKTIPLEGRGEGTVNLRTTDFPSGSYQYSLILDGKIQATKQMVLTNQ